MEFIRLWTIFIVVWPATCSVKIRRYATDLQENDYCGLNVEVYSGKCKPMKKCVNLLAEKKTIEVCSFNGDVAEETLVCCSREDFYKSRSMNREGPLDYEACMEKYKHLRKAPTDDFTKFTVNGVSVEPGEFPHQAAIGWLRWNDLTIDWNCGGALITESYVMSAAHCASHAGRKPSLVRFGDIDLTTFDDDANIQQFGILNVIRHPDYEASENLNDIALIQIKGQVFPTEHVVPACLLAGSPATEYFDASGYGQDGNGLQTNKLSKVQLKNVPMDKCQESYETIPLSDESQLCAQSYRDDIETQDTCYGDSGSPLQYMKTDYVSEDGRTYQVPTVVGLTSFGIGCAFGHPSVYVRVSNYIDWMESVIMP